MTESQVDQTSYEQRYPNFDYDPTYYDPGEVDDDLGRLRPQDTEERTSWGYLGVLLLVFVGLIASARACEALEDDPIVSDVRTDVPGVTVSSPVRLTAAVEGDIVTLRGAVPDQATRDQLVATIETIYNTSSLIDEITIDPTTTLDGGSIAVNGVAAEDDERPAQLRDAITEDFDLDDGGVTVDRSEEGALLPVRVDGFTEDGTVRLSGALPDQESIDNLIAAAEAAWGAGSVSPGGLTVDDRTWTDAQIRVTGTVAPGETSHLAFATEVQNRLGAEVTVDVTGVETDLNAEALAAIETEIREAVTANPILFAPQSAELDAASDAVLTVIAQRLNEIPEVQVEIVGHTDDLGPDDENMILSEQRAEAVRTRLIELGILESRLSARGEGEQFPLVDEDTDEARAQNRRIEFNLITG